MTPLNLFPNQQFEPPRSTDAEKVSGDYVQIDDERCYRIGNSHLMPDFFMTVASSSDHWMFLSSRGAVTAGRKDPDFSLFPYLSSDKIIDAAGSTGPKTIIRCRDWEGTTRCWEPFADAEPHAPAIHRNIYKNGLGNKVYLEEINESLGLVFRYRWTFGMEFGFVRTCWLENRRGSAQTVELLDGIQNLLPCGLNQDFQLRYSNLGDAYKKNELLTDSQIGVYYLSSVPTDRAEPSEGLRATVAWQCGLDRPTVLLCDDQVSAFRAGQTINSETDVRAARGAYFVSKQIQLHPDETVSWSITANVAQDQTDVIDLEKRIIDASLINRELQLDVQKCQDGLLSIVSSCDGRQLGSDELSVQRHQSNTLFNVMRGGYPSTDYQIDTGLFAQHVKRLNADVFHQHDKFIRSLGDSSQSCDFQIDELKDELVKKGDPDLIRHGLEYLPLTFGRRHGDPTRPWNKFSIDIRNEDGSTKASFQGNWRDIFQNWEALSLAYPKFAESMVFRFVNASTADGYNPYRVTNDGFEWESPEPNDSWSNIGYWGDHQIVYLLKLLQWSMQFNPDGLSRWLDEDCCVYAEIPYRIRDYDAIRNDPRHTIDFDRELDQKISERTERQGADGKLLRCGDDTICRATLAEKLLVPMLVKLTNFVPDGGIWLNTQRPEWNDANNAIVGNGLSMVTVCYLRRYLAFMIDWFDSQDLPQTVRVAPEVASLLKNVAAAIGQYCKQNDQDVTRHDHADEPASEQANTRRRQVVDALQIAGCEYRKGLYRNGLESTKVELSLGECVQAFRTCIDAIDRSIRNNRRSDGLYESYNVLAFGDETIQVEPLYEMLEGQVAVLSSGLLTPAEAVDVLDALRTSKLYRDDQQSYMLYPDRDLPRFVEKNRLTPDSVFQSELLAALVAEGDKSVVRMDVRGDAHFSGKFRNRKDLDAALDTLSQRPEYAELVERERASLNELFEQTFNHRKFTGRSGTFFGYEGLGSIYWHMVSKLALATVENFMWADERSEGKRDEQVLKRLHEHYREIRSGIGYSKTPDQYGAFPSDPYSHTPKHAGVQQPGMTGQVKEDILCRFAELGVRVDHGVLHFHPVMFEEREFLREDDVFILYDIRRQPKSLLLPAGCFAFTICQTPIVYQHSDRDRIVIHYGDQEVVRADTLSLTRSETVSLHDRRGEITQINVNFRPKTLTESSSSL